MSEIATQESIVRLISTMLVDESPLNPRKTFDKETLAELAEDLGRHGMLQPVLVRPHPKKPPGSFELIFGARRLRAARLAKLETIPAMVRDLVDEQVLELQIVENTKRDGIEPLEEAEAYEQLHTRFHQDVDDIAKKVGKSKAYVYGRMKLLALGKEGRKALAEGTLVHSVALLLARVSPELQAEALEELLDGDSYTGPMSARDAAEFPQRSYMLKLADAPFDRADATLLPAVGACTLFADVKFLKRRGIETKNRGEEHLSAIAGGAKKPAKRAAKKGSKKS